MNTRSAAGARDGEGAVTAAKQEDTAAKASGSVNGVRR